MKKLLSILLVLTMGPVLVAGLQSCTDCNPGDSSPIYLKVTGGYNGFFQRLDSNNSPIKGYWESDTIPANIQINPIFNFNTERVALLPETQVFGSTLMACDNLFPEYRYTQTYSLSLIHI